MNQHMYDDIISLPHHQSERRRHMTLYNRAAQFAPYDALSGYSDTIHETARQTDAMTELGEDQKAILEQRLRLILAHAESQPAISCTYYIPDERKSGGLYVTVTGVIRRYDALEQKLVLFDAAREKDGITIYLSDIVDLNCRMFDMDIAI